jgi:hypothetical protein
LRDEEYAKIAGEKVEMSALCLPDHFRDPAQCGESSGRVTQTFQYEWMSSSLEIESYR